jgi:Flp pilus assembly protein TadD
MREAHDMLGAELAQEGKFAEAQHEFEEVIRLQPGHAEGHLNLGIALARQRRFEDAVAEYNEAIRLEPQNRKAQEFLSTVKQLQKQQP